MTILSLIPATTYNFRQYGAKGDGVTDDTTAIQAALTACQNAGGGTVYGGAGTFLIRSPLVIYSNTRLILDSSCTITLAPSSNCNMIHNAGVTAQRSVSDANITSGQTSLTSATAHFTNADVGRSATITGAWTGGYLLTARIVSVQSSTACTIDTTATATVSGVACSFYTVDSNIEICGGYWQRGANGYTGGTSQDGRQTILMRHVDNFSLHDLTCACSVKGYQVTPQDVNQFSIKNITFVTPNTVVNTDGVGIQGPAHYGLVDGMYGTTGDDFVSLHSVDADASLRATLGPISDIVVANLFPNNTGQRGFITECGVTGGPPVRSVTCRGIHGSTAAPAIALFGDSSNILVEDVDVLTGSTSSLAYISTSNSTNTIALKNFTWRQVGSNAHIVEIPSGALAGDLTLDGLNIEVDTGFGYAIRAEAAVNTITLANVHKTSTSTSFSALVEIASGVTVKSVTIRDSQIIAQSTGQNALLSVLGSLTTGILSNIYLSAGDELFSVNNAGATFPDIHIGNVTLDNAYQLGQINASCAAYLTLCNVTVFTLQQSVLIALVGSGAGMQLRGTGLVNPNTYTAFSRDGTQTPQIVHLEMRVDLSTVSKNNGDIAYNTNAGLGCGVGVAISNGSNWKNIYSGSIY